jgi:hypothetical protein
MTSLSDGSRFADAKAGIFAATPWKDIPRRALGRAVAVPNMLSPMERRLYLWLAEHWAKGDGAIVDLGCFAGGSTACLAEGVRRAGQDRPVVAFDRFTVSEDLKASLLYPAGVPTFEGADLLPVAGRLLEPWRGRIVLKQGEIEDATWSGGPIEVLTIDAAKTARAADRIAETFFPWLVPGRSVVVQQDYLHWKVPWIAAQMEWMGACFVPLAQCRRDTVVFLCTSRPTAADLAGARVTRRRDRELIEAIGAASSRLAPLGIARRISALAGSVARNPNMRRAKDMRNRP